MTTKQVDKIDELLKKIEKAPNEAAELISKALIKKQTIPPISDTVAKAKDAIAKARKVKIKQRQEWRCSNCGQEGIQLYQDRRGHFHMHLEDGAPVHEDGTPLNLEQMAAYSMAKSGRV